MPTVVLTDEKFAAAAERLPTAPQVFSRLSAAMKNPDISVDEIVNIVRLDPALSARVLRLANGVHFSRGEPVNNLAEAINRTGFEEVYRLVGAAMSSQLYITGLPVYGVGGDELWANSLTTALALEFIADTAGLDRTVGYTLGLLRSVGRLMLQRLAAQALLPPLSGRKEKAGLVTEWERATFGIDNADAAERLFTLWKFPAELAAPVRYQFSPTADPQRGRFTALLHVAAGAADALGKGLPIEREAWDGSEDVLLQAGIGLDAVEACVEKTRVASAKLETLMRAAA